MKKTILTLLVVSFLIGSCRRKEAEQETKIGGCTDTDSPFYKPSLDFDDGTCTFAFANAIEVIRFPEKNNGSAWDDFGGRADIYVKFKPVSSATYDNYFNKEGDDKGNANHDEIHTWNINSPFKLTNEDWYWELMDKDGIFAGSDDKIASGIVNPTLNFDTNNDWVLLTNSNGEVQIKVRSVIR